MATTQTTTVFAPKLSTLAAAVPSTQPSEPRPRPYKDFLTPALHRRFTRAFGLILAASYVTSAFISPPNLLWFWNPLSFVWLRTIILLIPCLCVFTIRVANMRVGQLANASRMESIWQIATSWKAPHTFAWYFLSAFLFGEVFLWTKGNQANLGGVDRGRSFADGLEELPVVNENPIFLRVIWYTLALLQTVAHLARGEDRLPIPEKEADEKKKVSSSKLPQQLQELVDYLPTLLRNAAQVVVPGVVSSIPVYFLIIRYLVWSVWAACVGVFYSQLPPRSDPTGLIHLPMLILQATVSASLLVLLWEFCSAVFTIYVCQPPLRHKQPLTTEIKDAQGNIINRSNDPNGSLLNGLKSRKELVKAFAFWELRLICERFDTRRKTIYTEVDRKDGGTWVHISKQCLCELEEVQKRINEALNPTSPTPPPPPQDLIPSDSTPQTFGLPKIADREVVTNGDVLLKSKQSTFSHRVGDAAKSLGQSPQSSQNMQIRARKALEWSTDQILPKRDQKLLAQAPATLAHDANSKLVSFLHSPFGEPFIHTFSRRAQTVVFGHPNSSRTNLVHASQSLSILCVHSLQEDDYAQVADSVPEILRTYTATITAVASFMATLAPHWTDVAFTDRDRRVPEIEEVLVILKAGLEGVLLAFAEYADAVGVTKKELREAKEALGKGLEMRRV